MESDLIIVVAVLFATSLSFSVSYATNNDQTPNTQIINSNTSGDNGAYNFLSFTTSNSFSIGSSAFTFQMNSLINNCPSGDGCAWWIQAIVGIDSGSLVGKSGGYWPHDVHLEMLQGTNNYIPFCQQFPNLINIDQTGYTVQETDQINIGCGYFCDWSMTLSLTVLNSQGQSVASVSESCSNPSYNSYQLPVESYQQTEAVVAGCGSSACGANVAFSPLNTKIFSGYFQEWSNYNQMSSSSRQTQTAEGSNLYQTGVTTSSGHNGLYYYQVNLNDQTKSDS